ncbi:MAG: hypothetical protein H6709_09480 [Kofleriaceae bacterium]|nr:hypothetical protein [Kofleriaceae bacterium]MCB9572302.1 hypothetical protein [Kofleriaceae bacterium]
MRPPGPRLLAVVVAAAVAVVISRPTPGVAAPCDPAEAAVRVELIRTELARESRRAHRWNTAWGITFAVLAAAQVGMAAERWTPLGDVDDDAMRTALWIGAMKSGLGAAARVVMPLRVDRLDGLSGDACTDVIVAERALRRGGRREQGSFFLLHAGSLAVNIAGMLWLGLVEDSWTQGVLSATIGLPVGLASVYTQPRDAWHAARDGDLLRPRWMVRTVRRPDFTGLVLDGAF